jgi:hypothetical protein
MPAKHQSIDDIDDCISPGYGSSLSKASCRSPFGEISCVGTPPFWMIDLAAPLLGMTDREVMANQAGE